MGRRGRRTAELAPCLAERGLRSLCLDSGCWCKTRHLTWERSSQEPLPRVGAEPPSDEQARPGPGQRTGGAEVSKHIAAVTRAAAMAMALTMIPVILCQALPMYHSIRSRQGR